MLVESKSIATKFQTSLQTGNTFVLQLGNYSKQIQKQYRIQAISNLLSAVAITVELLLFRVDFPVLWGFLAFILGFIPNVGLIIACLPAIIIALILYGWGTALDRKSTRLNSSHTVISYAVFCLKKKKKNIIETARLKCIKTFCAQCFAIVRL